MIDGLIFTAHFSVSQCHEFDEFLLFLVIIGAIVALSKGLDFLI